MFGNFLKLDAKGASHAKALTFTLENFPAGFTLDTDALAAFMERRAPGRDALSTARREPDAVEFVSGVKYGVTDGSPIVGRIANCDMRPADYGAERTIPRPGHADFGQWVRFGRIPTGGGRNSGRLTAPLCAAGAICLQWLAKRGVSVSAMVASIHGRTDASGQIREIERARDDGNSVGGIVSCAITGLTAGLGGALFDGLESELSAAMFAIPGVKGVEFGGGFSACDTMRGSEFNDAFTIAADGAVRTATNRHGGILGGRASGMPVEFRVAFRPTPTIFRPQPSVDLATMRPATCEMKGRHDPCIARRAVPVVEALAAFAAADLLLAEEAAHPRICLTLTGRTLEEDLRQFHSQRLFTDMVELRVDLLEPSERGRAAEFPALVGVPAILTFRRKRDGGAYAGGERARIAFFRKTLSAATDAAASCRKGFAYVDFEDDFRVSELDALARRAGVRIVRSLHDFEGPVRNIAAKCRAMVGGTDEIAKIAFMPRDLGDVARIFRELAPPAREGTDSAGIPRRNRGVPPHVVLAMGPQGMASRVLAGRLGSLWTYASVGGLGDLGHVTPRELVRDYRLRSASQCAALYGVTGWPLLKTRSPELHNAAFLAEDADAVMVPFPARTAREAFAFMKAMGMKGMAVTIPHKFSIMPLLDRIDPVAKRIGAVNTVVERRGRHLGFNTDVTGFAEALAEFAGDVRGKRVALLGDGGAAQGVKAALRRLGADFEVFHRKTPPQGFDLIVNATPVDPIPDYVFTGREIVYDLRYTPDITPLMERAAAAGCRVSNGFSMLDAQARGQRRIWRV